MDIVSKFKDLNNPIRMYESMDISAVRQACNTKLNWNFLHSAAINIIERNSLNTIEVINILHMYKFVDPLDIVEMLRYALHLNMTFLTSIKIPDSMGDLCTKENILVSRDPNGVDMHVYIGLHKLRSEAELSVLLTGRHIIFHYLLPYNYEILRDPLFQKSFEWDYYALFNRFLLYCVENNASDIHFDVAHFEKKPTYRALVRIGPDREVCDLFPLTAQMNKGLIKDTITERSSNKGAVLDLDNNRGVVVNIKDAFGDGRLDIRFEANKVFGGYYCVCRLQEQKTISLTIDKLGFDERCVKLLRENIQRPSGLTVFTGKIRTGKNTTMSAFANEIVLKDTKPSIMALDDPIEILGKYPQVDYRGDTEALKSYIRLAKKQDLDFCMLNEIPNAEVAFGVRDLTNSSIHTVTTWHMNRLWHIGYKLFEYFGEGYRDILSQINLICNQRLYKGQCPHCLVDIHRESHVKEPRIYNFFIENELFSSKVAQGCDKCNYTGYNSGSIVVLPEILKFDHDLLLEVLKADRPYQMEAILIEHVRNSGLSLERQMCAALEDGRLSPNEILTIV